MGAYDVGLLKMAENAILDRIAAGIENMAANVVKELAEAFSLLENASKK